MKSYKFLIYSIIEDSDSIMFVTNINIFGINRISIDAKNKSDHIPVPNGDPIWANYGPEYIKMRFGASYESTTPIKLEPNLLLYCNDPDLPEFTQDSGYWRLLSYSAKKNAKISNLITFDAELMLYMNDQPSWK